MKVIQGGVTAAMGFTAAGMHCGVKSSNPDKKDVALIYSEKPCTAAGAFTRNVVKAAPVVYTKEMLRDGRAQAVVVNSGNANACAPHGEVNTRRMAACAASALGLEAKSVAVASTGVIGQTLNIDVIEQGIPVLAKNLSRHGGNDASLAIMTTDTVQKQAAVELTLDGKTVTIGGMAKGSGMIHPNMGTMLCFITTDAAISAEMLRRALLSCVDVSFNRISVDGDTSTNDSCIIMANGLAGNREIIGTGADYDEFCAALRHVCIKLARMMAADGEGAKHLVTCLVRRAASVEKAECVGKSIIRSPLVKTAIFGTDANWGRILAAAGYSGAEFDPEKCSVAFMSDSGSVKVCENGRGLIFDESLAKKVLSEKEIIIDFDMNEGAAEAACWGCDLSYDYVKINGDYRT